MVCFSSGRQPLKWSLVFQRQLHWHNCIIFTRNDFIFGTVLCFFKQGLILFLAQPCEFYSQILILFLAEPHEFFSQGLILFLAQPSAFFSQGLILFLARPGEFYVQGLILFLAQPHEFLFTRIYFIVLPSPMRFIHKD